MAVASFWTQEFLEEVSDALEVSLGRVTVTDLQSNPTVAAHLEQAQEWLRAAKRSAAGSPSDKNNSAMLPPFPLTGAQLRALQSAVDQALLARTAQKAGSKMQRIVNQARNEAPVPVYERLRYGLERVHVSARILGGFLAFVFALNVVAWIFFHDAMLHPALGVESVLSAIALLLWVRHYVHLSNHSHYVEGIGGRI